MTREEINARIDAVCARPSPWLKLVLEQNRVLNEIAMAEAEAPVAVYQYQPGNAWFNPGYRYDGDKPTTPAPAFAPAVVRCECGSEKAGCGPGAHSDWCPKAPKP